MVFGKSAKWAFYIKRDHGMTYKEYNALFRKQKGCCAICGKHQTEQKRRLSVDHNHTTCIIRELLCDNCNDGIGMFKESIEILRNAIDYLEKHR